MEEILHSLLLGSMTIYEIFASSTKDDLSGNADLGIFLKPNWRFLFVTVIEDNGDTGFSDSSLTSFVDEILKTFHERGRLDLHYGQGPTCRFCALTVLMLVMPRTKHIESKILDFPLPFRPVMELKLSSLSQISALSGE